MSRYVLSLLASATSHVGGVRYACGIPPFDAKVSVLPSAAVVSSMYLTGLKASLRGVRSDKGFSLLRAKNLAGEAAETLGRLAGCGLAFVGDVGVKVLADGLGLNSIALTLSLAEAVDGLASSREAGPVGGERISGGGIGVGTCMLAIGALYC